MQKRSYLLKSSLFLLGTILFSFNSLAFDKDLKTINDRVPLEFNHLFESMKLEIKTPSEKIRLVGLAQELNQNLGLLGKEHIFLLMKSEVIKNVLEHKFAKVRQFDVSTLLIDRLNKNFTEKEKYLNPFSLWIWRSVIAELNHRKNLGLISEKSFSSRSFTGEKQGEAQRFERYLKYLLPWIDKMDSLSASEFNELSKEVSWTILRRLNDRSILFKRFASTTSSEPQITLINIPPKLLELKPEEIKTMQADSTPESLKEASMRERNEAQDKMDQVTPEDLSPLSEDVARELEKKSETLE